MDKELFLIAGTAVSVGFLHTIFGPDHYLPFVAMSRTWNWSKRKTAIITMLCGLGHVLSSVILGAIGVALGLALGGLEFIEAHRGDIAAWFLLAFGLAYFIWGVRYALRSKVHEHVHAHGNGEVHSHGHGHHGPHSHVHANTSKKLTPWALFLIFVFGPCEPLIPVLMYPAADINLAGVALVALLFGVTTIATMLGVVMAAVYGLTWLPSTRIGKYSHALAGLVIFFCGYAIKFMGL